MKLGDSHRIILELKLMPVLITVVALLNIDLDIFQLFLLDPLHLLLKVFVDEVLRRLRSAGLWGERQLGIFISTRPGRGL